MAELKCPICGKPTLGRKQNPHFPFCSDRCRLIDLGKWMGGDYRVPGQPVETDEGEPPPPREVDEE